MKYGLFHPISLQLLIGLSINLCKEEIWRRAGPGKYSFCAQETLVAVRSLKVCSVICPEGVSMHAAPPLAARSIHPLAIKVMDEIGIDISGQEPKSVKTYLGKATISFIITVCTKTEDSCPHIWPGIAEKNRLYWPFDDPAGVEGTIEDKLRVFRQVRDQLREKITDWLNSTEK